MKKVHVVGALLLLGACAAPPRTTSAPSYDIHQLVPVQLLRDANHGRNIEGPDGRFVVPRTVKRAWIDVGAHMMEWTRPELETRSDIMVVAIEPLSECWKTWADTPRLIALPVAISIERGVMDFNVNAANVTSSLLKSVEGNSVSALTRTVEVRKVPVLRLEDALERIPPEIDVDFLKTDVQGLDLQVLKSAGDQIRRVRHVRAEVINEKIYEPTATIRPGTETEFVEYMTGKGFQFEGDTEIWTGRAWLDKIFVNPDRMGWMWRARRRLGSLFS
jgi:FkbM family methyltransferase